MEHRIRKMLEGGGGLAGRLLRASLWLPGKLYGLAVTVRRHGYERDWFSRFRPPVPVVSVGNVTAGGSGKTPFVIMLSSLLRDNGLRPAILLRGYRETARGDSDEALLYRERVPEVMVHVGRDRAESARAAVRDGADVLLMDDGMQHLRLRRDLEIVLIDATSPWGGGNTFPGGLLREPLSALRVADVVVVTRSDQVRAERLVDIQARLARLAPGADQFAARHAPVGLFSLSGTAADLAALAGRQVIALAGIARPEAFSATLESCGATVIRMIDLPDHADIPAEVVEAACRDARASGAVVVTTEKDQGKIVHSLEGRDASHYSNVIPGGEISGLWVLRVEQRLDDEDGFRQAVLGRVFPEAGGKMH